MMVAGQVVRRCSWWNTTSASATMSPMRQGQPRQRRSALKLVVSRELARSPRGAQGAVDGVVGLLIRAELAARGFLDRYAQQAGLALLG